MEKKEQVLNNAIKDPSEESLDNEQKEVAKIDRKAEDTLSFIAYLCISCGLLAALYCCVKISVSYGIAVAASSVITWSLLKVIANISISLKELNNKIK